MIDAKETDAHPTDSETINSPSKMELEKVDPEPMVMEDADPDSQAEGERFDSDDTYERGHTPTTSAGIAQPEPLGEEVKGERFDSENAYEWPSEQTNSAEIAHPEPLGEEVNYSPPASSDNIHSALEGTEHVHTKPVVSDHMLQQAVSSEIVHSKPLSSEMIDSHLASTGMVDSHMVTSEMVHSLTDAGSLPTYKCRAWVLCDVVIKSLSSIFNYSKKIVVPIIFIMIMARRKGAIKFKDHQFTRATIG